MTTINVQFSDATEASVTSYFGCPQDPDLYPNQAEISASDARWKAYFEAQLASIQQYLPAPVTS
ncbi:hypothetical protein EOS_33090 [Caballeronia mineralivorans PML1(12)]|uniref:Uncharacterized protein n=1 Tax=Caballeronia mineralivorans PML1(12) TaxID=908627 RepID=A0A0J1FQE9_9BURK|nr:hypothetical protein EOS_33090 [Caballeronia mineralivorans PML1(12)]